MPARSLPLKPSHLAAAIVLGLAVPGVSLAQESAPASGNSARTLDTVTVTGSRIKRTEVEAQLPVTVLQKERIDELGISSAEQLLMFLNIAGNGSDNLASNGGIVSEEQRGNNGVSGANLRGQGADATLVLLNGRRVATHGLKGRAVDLNSIPFAALDRVEVLRDGASAVYGTDAIGGVINFITKSDYTGLEASTFVDVTEEGGGNIFRANLLGGWGDLDNDRWNVFGTVTVKKNEILRGTDRDYSNTFQADRGLSPDTRGTPFATVFSLGSTGVGATSLLRNGQIDPADPPGPNPLRQTAINILDLPGASGCASGGDMMGPYDHRLWSSTASRFACAWDYPAAAIIQQPQKSVDFIGRATFKISDNHRAYVELVGSQVDVEKTFEPNQISSSTSTATTALGPSTWYPLNATTQATYDMIYNALATYFGAGNLNYGAPIAYRWRCIACGPRQIETTTKSYRFLTSVEGSLGSKWDYNVGLSRASSKSESTLGSGFHYTDALRTVLGSGLLNPFLMPGQEQSAAAMSALDAASAAGVMLYGGESILTTLDATFSGSLGFSLPGGEVLAATGIDLRREEFKFDGDSRVDRRPVFNAPFDDSNILDNVSRDIKAVYAEVYLPLLDNLDITVAGRYDEYDGFGSTTNPKVSFKFEPFEGAALRGAYSTGFKVPSFNQLFNGVTETLYVGQDLADPATCPSGIANPAVAGCESIRPVELFGGKEDLQPEESTQKSFGVVLAPVDWLNVSVDWWEIERENTIRSAPRDILIQYYDVFAANWIRDASGEVVAIDRRYVNSGGSLMRGIEIDGNVMGDLAGGTFRLNLNGSYINTFKTKALETLPYTDNLVGDYVRYYNLPIKWKHTLTFTWQKGDWSHNLSQIYRDGYNDELPVSVRNNTYIPENWNPRVSNYTTYNYSLVYSGIERMKLTFGVKNVFDEDPPFTAHQNDFAAGAAWEPRIADPRGRAYTLLMEYKFR
ncbi:iron complex outermembrane recepter protein [Pseudoxanthomonas sp. CF385]|uniref:TonB-dependent receptor domain-containing protein n=1 Tax=Pseudoxanthomonas sp. CF385 TaxID=1881042 RepID=UPI00088408FA|nr:TonB-dependent receptor [Pseudoxanthomonas sp. CF385]SDQ27101.1 iron complex outermembrane recepter protein [Pseudoxanthomonas sp. CF385]